MAACRALREEDFARILGAALLLIMIGTLTFTFGADWSVVDAFYVAVATLTTSSVLTPDLTITDPWLKVFTAGYVGSRGYNLWRESDFNIAYPLDPEGTRFAATGTPTAL